MSKASSLGVAAALTALLSLQIRAEPPRRELRLDRRDAATEAYPDLQRQLQNPLARILVFPAAFEYEEGGGTGGSGEAFTIRLGPRIPFELNDDWHAVSKTELVWRAQDGVVPGTRQEGFGDLIQTLFFSPDRSLAWDVYWGLGPTLVLPTASHDFVGSELVSVGPSFGFFRQRDRLTTGVILNHLWSVAGPTSAGQVNASRIEPVVAYTFPGSATVAVGAELTYDWRSSQWTGPLDLRFSQLTMIGDQPVQWGAGLRTYPFRQVGEPEWGAFLTLSFPIESPGWRLGQWEGSGPVRR